jgi:hypothetical protein
MRPGQQNKRGRGRGGSGGGNNNNRKGQNPLSRTYDSSGPDVKIRGTAQHIAEKYMNLARDAQSAGDRVMAENYLQHAEHYNRIIAAAQAQLQERFQRDDRDHQGRENDGDDIGDDDAELDASVNGNVMPAPVYANGNGHHQESRTEQTDRAPYEPDAPQPVISGTPAEVALGEETPVEGARTSRRRGRPRRARSGEAGEAGGNGEGEGAPVEVAAAD